MERKVVVITGATSGIGQVAAENLAGMGARIVQIARDRALPVKMNEGVI
jgi:NADP-dependent 3-hydroxy acid dehydrogenase YdfG